jgi:predicted metal-dependent peptidase
MVPVKPPVQGRHRKARSGLDRICIDTSASIGKDELGQFMAEIQSILDAYPQIKGTLFYADANLYGPHAFGAEPPCPR